MKKALIIILVILGVLGIAVASLAFVPKAINESKVNQLASGGVKEGKTAFVLNDDYEGSLNLVDGKAEFCFTTIIEPTYHNAGPTSFVKEKVHLYLIGKYSIGLDKNITIDVEECYEILELVGDEKNKAEYISIWSNDYKEHFDSGEYTLEDYNEAITRINGEKYIPSDKVSITSVKLRMDTESGKVYILSYNTNTFSAECSYHESGAIKSITKKYVGLVPVEVEEYDVKGNRLKKDYEREFYDNGVIKTETLDNDGEFIKLEYDSDGKLVKKYEHQFVETYEYNTDGVCINVKEYITSYDGNCKMIGERQIIGYGHWIRSGTGILSPLEEAEEIYIDEYYAGEIISSKVVAIE